MVRESTRQWDFYAGTAIEDLDAFCEASCIDVNSFTVGIYGYADLREVPLLAKFRTVKGLNIDVDGVRDLRGLEHVDVTERLRLQTHRDRESTFQTLEGLTDRDLDSIELEGVLGLSDFDGSRFDRIDTFSALGVFFQRVDLSNLTMSYVTLDSAPQLAELKLGGGTTGLTLHSTSLSTLTWRSDFKLQNVDIQGNPKLSSCVIQDFVAQTRSPGTQSLIFNNGPCP